MTLARIVLGFFGVSFLFFGVWAIAAPAGMAKLIHFDLLNATARIEFRAFYGGTEIAFAALLLAPLWRAEWAGPALVLLAAISAGIALARIVGIAVEQAASGFVIAALIWELSAVALATWAWSRINPG